MPVDAAVAQRSPVSLDRPTAPARCSDDRPNKEADVVDGSERRTEEEVCAVQLAKRPSNESAKAERRACNPHALREGPTLPAERRSITIAGIPSVEARYRPHAPAEPDRELQKVRDRR